MANYIVHYTKKFEIRNHKEQKLRRYLASGASEEKLLRMAADVLAARISALRMIRAKIVPTGGLEVKDQYDEIDKQISFLQASSPVAILAEFRGTQA